MKLTVIGNNWFPVRPGGLDRYIYELIHHLASSGTSINLYGLDLPPEESTSSIRLTNLAAAETSLTHRLRSSYGVLQALRQESADAINLHFALYGLPALPHLPKDVPVTCTFHGPWALESQQEGDSALGVWIKKGMEKLVYHRCDRFIVLSKAFGHILHQEYNIAWDKIHVIPGGVDTQQFQPTLSRQQAREKLGWPQDRFVLFTPRRLVHRMGLDKLLEAIAQLNADVQDVWLAIAGKGPIRDALEQQTADLGLSHAVKFLGFLPDEDLPIAYQAADLTVMPSQSLEGFGLVLLESLASGTPVLCTPVGGMPEVITDFSPDLITASPNADAIAETLDAILAGTIKLPDQAACRNYAVTRFNWINIADQVKHVLFN